MSSLINILGLALAVGCCLVVYRFVIQFYYPEARIGILPFLLTFLFLVVMTLLSVSRHIYVAMVSNPSRYLKDE